MLLEESDMEQEEPALYRPCRVGIAFFKALKILQSQTQSMLLSLPSHLYLSTLQVAGEVGERQREKRGGGNEWKM